MIKQNDVDGVRKMLSESSHLSDSRYIFSTPNRGIAEQFVALALATTIAAIGREYGYEEYLSSILQLCARVTKF